MRGRRSCRSSTTTRRSAAGIARVDERTARRCGAAPPPVGPGRPGGGGSRRRRCGWPRRRHGRRARSRPSTRSPRSSSSSASPPAAATPPGGCAGSATARRAPPAVPTMGYQPGLDGLRAVSVIVIMLYHAGFTWMHGGFFAVEVFFATSGFLITDAADRGAGAFRAHLVARLLGPAGPPAAPCARRAPRHRRRRHADRRHRQPGLDAAARLPVVDLLPQQLGPDPRRRPVLGGRPAAVAAPVDARDRGAVLPRVAAGVRRSRQVRAQVRGAGARRPGGGVDGAVVRHPRRRTGCDGRLVRRRRPGQLQLPVDDHPPGGPAARVGGGVRLAAVAHRRPAPTGGAGPPRPAPRRRRGRAAGRLRLRVGDGDHHRGLRVPVVARR